MNGKFTLSFHVCSKRHTICATADQGNVEFIGIDFIFHRNKSIKPSVEALATSTQ